MRAAALPLLPLLPLLPADLAAAPPAAKRGTSLVAVAISPSTISVTCKAKQCRAQQNAERSCQYTPSISSLCRTMPVLSL
jgi:hypothetical protein